MVTVGQYYRDGLSVCRVVPPWTVGVSVKRVVNVDWHESRASVVKAVGSRLLGAAHEFSEQVDPLEVWSRDRANA